MVKQRGSGKRHVKAESDLAALLALAQRTVRSDATLSRNAVRDAIRLSTRLRLRIPLAEKRKLCKNCFTFLAPGVTSTTRVANGRVIITCQNCGTVKRLQYRR